MPWQSKAKNSIHSSSIQNLRAWMRSVGKSRKQKSKKWRAAINKTAKMTIRATGGNPEHTAITIKFSQQRSFNNSPASVGWLSHKHNEAPDLIFRIRQVNSVGLPLERDAEACFAKPSIQD